MEKCFQNATDDVSTVSIRFQFDFDLFAGGRRLAMAGPWHHFAVRENSEVVVIYPHCIPMLPSFFLVKSKVLGGKINSDRYLPSGNLT